MERKNSDKDIFYKSSRNWCWVYILVNNKNDQIYIGSTSNLKRRLKEHNNGQEISTKKYMPWKLQYYEAYKTEELARAREKRLKQHGNAKRELKKRIGLSTNKSGAGFTLLEVVVVLAMFSVLTIVIVNVFILTLRSQRQASLRQNTLANLRYVMEIISRQVRISEIDYGYANYSPSIDLVENELALKDSINPDRQFVYYLAGQEIKLAIIENGTTEEAWLTTINDVKVVSLDFYISPITDPFSVIADRCNQNSDCDQNCTINDPTGDKAGFCTCAPASEAANCPATLHCDAADNVCLPFDKQPRVTIVLDFESVATRPENIKRIYLQTTVSSRAYKR